MRRRVLFRPRKWHEIFYLGLESFLRLCGWNGRLGSIGGVKGGVEREECRERLHSLG